MIDTLGSAAALGNSPCRALGISSRGALSPRAFGPEVSHRKSPLRHRVLTRPTRLLRWNSAGDRGSHAVHRTFSDGIARYRHSSAHGVAVRGLRAARSHCDGAVHGRDGSPAKHSWRHPGLHRRLHRVGEPGLRRTLRPVRRRPTRLRPGSGVRSRTVLAGHRIAGDELRHFGGDRSGQSRQLSARFALHGDGSALHINGVSTTRRFVIHGVQLLPEWSDRQPGEGRPYRPSACRHGELRIRVQPQPSQRRNPRTVRRRSHSDPGGDLQRRHRDELTATDTIDDSRRGSSVRPGSRLSDQSTEPDRRPELPDGIPLRTSRGRAR